MRKFALVVLLTVLGSLAFAADPKPYDSSAMVQIMRSNGTLVGQVTKAVNAGDWDAVAAGFIQLAQNAGQARQYAPPKGDAAEWNRIWSDFLSASWKGVGSAGEKDAAKAKAALAVLTGDRNTGHSQFK